MPDNSDLRREQRFALNRPVSLKIEGPSKSLSGTGGIFDVSEHGLSFTFQKRLEPGDSITVEYEGCLVRGEVRHCRVRQYAERRFLIGMAVTNVVRGEDTWRRLIQQCCAGA
jgi:hypothetical protein